MTAPTKELEKLSRHLRNPETRFDAYRLIVSSGNGAAKTAFGAMTMMMLMYTQKMKARVTANTQPQLNTVVWPEWDKWYRYARFSEFYFEKFGTSIKAKNAGLADTWRVDAVTWSEQSPASISGLHNEGKAVAYVFEEAPGIPAVIWDYTKGAFSDTGTIKIFMAFGNSDDPNSKFEQNMTSPLWHARRIDTRTMKHVDQKIIADWLMECGGNEDHDDFRVRVRGMARKSAKDSIISLEAVQAALGRRRGFDKTSVEVLPCVITVDPAWRGGDFTTIAYQQGNYRCLLDMYRLESEMNETHMLTFQKICHFERELKADAVLVDQGEGTALYTLAINAGKTSWHLISFAGEATDAAEFKDRQYANIRAQMYYETAQWCLKGGVLDALNPEWIPIIEKQMTWTQGGRHKINQKKIAEPKLDIKARVGASPDVADALVMPSAMQILERLPEHGGAGADFETGDGAWHMPSHPEPYEDMDADIYD